MQKIKASGSLPPGSSKVTTQGSSRPVGKALTIKKEIKMKKWMLVSIVISLVLVITACGNSQSASASATATTTLSREEQLLVGTIKLESTDLDVSADQAKELLPLWMTLQSMASSGTSASEEVDAVVSQIESIMSSKQISSISTMNLSQQDLMTAITDTGTSLTASSAAGTTNASSLQAQAGAGAPADGNPPADMSGSMPPSSGAQPVDQAQTVTQTSSSQATGTTSQVTTALINTLVELLQKKVV
jgi:hypothetical protein